MAAALAQQPPAWLAALLLGALANLVRAVLALRGLGRAGPRAAPTGWLELNSRGGRWLAGGVVLYVALLTGPLGAARFVVPVWPLVLALALRGLPEAAVRGRSLGAKP